MTYLLNKRWPMSAVLAIVLVAGWTAADARATDCFILSAGVDNYPQGNKLKGDLNDARNVANAFQAQQGKLFNNVYPSILLDQQATGANFMQHLQNFSRMGRAGDYYVIFFSGHGGRFSDTKQWYFVPYDMKPVSGASVLKTADYLVRQGKKVVIIIDACFSGQLNVEAQPYLRRYVNGNGGGLIVMCSSSADQLSNALGNYSAFAKAFSDGMAGNGDLNHDGAITLNELRSYTYQQTYNLLRKSSNQAKQDSMISWSPSFSGDTALGAMGPTTVATGPTTTPRPIPTGNRPVSTRPVTAQAAIWAGSENLQGFGTLTIQLFANGRAVMIDAKSVSEGNWQRNGNQVSFVFSGGRVVYTGTVNGSNIVGTADNQRINWSFSLQRQVPQS